MGCNIADRPIALSVGKKTVLLNSGFRDVADPWPPTPIFSFSDPRTETAPPAIKLNYPELNTLATPPRVDNVRRKNPYYECSSEELGLFATESDGAPDTIRTCGLRLRRATLYPAELRVLALLTQCLRGNFVTVKRSAPIS